MRYLSLSGVFVCLGVAFFWDEFGVDAAPAAAAEETLNPASTRESKKANIFSLLSQKQIDNFKESLQRTGVGNGGIISKNDLRTTSNAISRLANDELDDILGDHISSIADEDNEITNAPKAFDHAGKINPEKLLHTLTTWGKKFTADGSHDDAQKKMAIDNKSGIDIGNPTARQEDEEKEARTV